MRKVVMLKHLLSLTIFFCLYSCGIFKIGSGNKYDKSNVTEVEFFDLKDYDGAFIKTRLEYSGIEEYWSAKGFSDCEFNNEVYLNFDEYYDGWKWIFINGQLSKIRKKYWIRKAEMVVIGQFEMAKKEILEVGDSILTQSLGFGHLGTNKAQIIVKKVKIKVKKI